MNRLSFRIIIGTYTEIDLSVMGVRLKFKNKKKGYYENQSRNMEDGDTDYHLNPHRHCDHAGRYQLHGSLLAIPCFFRECYRKAGLHPHKRPPIRRKIIASLMRKAIATLLRGKSSAAP